MLLHQSGLLGLSARSQDMRALEAAASGGDDAAAEAIEVFCYRVRKAIGSYCAVLGRVDALVFTGGIGEHSASMRQHVLDGLHHMGLQLDAARNRQDASCEGEISLVDSPVKILVVPTNEELVIAREVRDALAN
jgi:acetate kinase